MNGIFISYRRDDAAGYAGRLYDRLAARFGAQRVFMDVEGIEPGTDFVDAIERAVGSCEVLIVIIGNDWLNAVDAMGQRRLDDPADFVRLEAAAALARNIRVVPVLVEGAVMPRADQLPPELAPLARRQAVELSHKQWDSSSAELIATLERILERDKASAPAEQALAPSSLARAALPPPAPEPIGSDLRKWGIGAAILLAIGGTLALLQPWREEAKSPTAQQPAVPAKSAEPSPAIASAPPAAVSPQPAAAQPVPAAQEPAAAEAKPAPVPAAGGTPAPAAPAAKATPATPPVAAAPVQPKAEAAPAPPRIVRFESKRVGDKMLLCYGVSNAVEAAITPQPGAVKPAAQECVSVTTEARQTYTLSARNAAGSVVTRSVTVEAAPVPPAERLVAVPELIGKPRREAVAELEKAGFQVRVVEDKLDPQASAAAGSVVAQLPRGGEQLQAGGRVTLQIMPDAPPQAAIAPSPLPRVGDTWQYRYSSIWKNVEPRTFVHSVTGVSEREIRETMSLGAGKAVESKAFGPEPRFVEWRGAGYYRPEFNPFLQSFGALQTGSAWKSLATPVEDPFYGDWYTQGRVVGWDSVVVPAGSFKALRVELNSNRNASGSPAMLASEPVRVWHVVWYAADAKRAVKHMRTVFSAKGGKLDEDTYELVKYQLR